MNNQQYPFGYAQPQPMQQIQQMFPQPQGSVYSINELADIGNVPIGSTGLSVAICFQQQIMYIKSFQNGSPVIMAYRIAPYSKDEPVVETQSKDTIQQLTEKVAQLEAAIGRISSQGGTFNGLL